MDGVSPSVVTYGALMDALSRRVGALTGGSRAGGRKLPKAATTRSARRFPARWVGCASGGALREEMDDRWRGGSRRAACSARCWRRRRPRRRRRGSLRGCPVQGVRVVRGRWKRPGSRARATRTRRSSRAAVNAGDADRATSEARSGRVKRTAAVFAASIHACGSTSDGADLPAALAIWEDMRAESVEADAMLYATLHGRSGRARSWRASRSG